jgi:putative ABC transport system substrate-binding protein
MITKNFVIFAALCAVLFVGCQSLYTPENGIKVAILYPISHPSLEKIKEAFKEKLVAEYKKPITFIDYNGSANRMLMHQQTEQALAQNPDLIFAVASSSAAMLVSSALKQKSQTPIVCGAADIELLQVHGKLPPHVACVTDIEEYAEQLRLLKDLRPSLKKLLIVHDQNCAKYERDLTHHIKPIAARMGIELVIVPVNSAQEINQKIPLSIAGVDAIMIFKDSMVVSALETLVKICSNNGITLYTSDLDSVARGAAAGFGLEEAETGRISGKIAAQILHNKITKFVPVILKPDALLINRTTMHSQGLSITQAQLKDTARGTEYIIREGK